MMAGRTDAALWSAAVATLVLTNVLLLPATGLAQHHGSGDTAADKALPPEPYGGQLYCPITGKKLGLNQPPVAVQTTIGEKKPSFMDKLFGKKGTPGAIIYVCCPQCVEKARANAPACLNEVIADKACFSFSYAKAPANRPPRAGMDSSRQPQNAANREPDQGLRRTSFPPP